VPAPVTSAISAAAKTAGRRTPFQAHPVLLLTRARIAALAFALIVLLLLLVWRTRKSETRSSTHTTPVTNVSPPEHDATDSGDAAPTSIYAHNLMLRKGPSFRVYVRWLQGQMTRTRGSVDPSFDDPDSFYLDVKTGVLRANIGDIGNYLNAGGLGNAPLQNVTLSGNGDQIKLTGTLHKVVPLPVDVLGQISALPDGRIQIHVTKINLLKIPFKALLGGFHIALSDLFNSKDIPGVQVAGNDLFIDTTKLLPPPHIRGQLSAVRVVNPDLEAVYGNAETQAARVEQWRNFLRLSGGTIDFGKLTMHQVDLVMIDISDDPWFDLDLTNYQKQLVNGYTRMTPEAGLQIFMPDLSKIPQNQATQKISIEWMKNRAIPPPKAVTRH
jgi:hypothetical protein